MSFTANVVDGQIILASWGNQIRDRTIQVFATAAERDSQWAAPPTGAMCVTLDTGWLWRRTASRWVPPWGTVVYQNTAAIPDGNYTTTGLRDVVTAGPSTPFTFDVSVAVMCALNVGFSGGQTTYQADLVNYATGAVIFPNSGPFLAPASMWVPTPMVGSATVAAGAEPRVKARINIQNTGGGTAHTAGNLTVTYSAANV